MIGDIDIIAVELDVDRVGLAAVKLSAAGDIGIDFLLRANTAGNINMAHEQTSISCDCKGIIPQSVVM